MDKLKPWEITIKDTVSAVFRQKKVVILTFSVVMIVAFVGLKLQTPMYEASVKMLIRGRNQVASASYQAIAPFRIHLTQAEIVKSNPVIYRAVKVLNLQKRPLDYEKNFTSVLKGKLIDLYTKDLAESLNKLTPEEQRKFRFDEAMNNLKSNLRTSLIPNTDIFIITVKDYSTEGAKSIANVISRSYSIFDQEQQLAELTLKYGKLHPSVIQLKDNILKMSKGLHGRHVSTLEAIGTASVKVIEQAVANNMPVGKPKPVIMLIAIFISGFLSVAFALSFNYFDNTFKSPNEILKYLNMPVIGTIPKRKFYEKSLISNAKKNNQYTDFYRDLSEQLLIFMKTQQMKTILIASAMKHNSNSSIIANIGLSLANNMGHKILIIDGNLKNPSFHKIFNLEKSDGLLNVINGEDVRINIQNVENNLSVLPTSELAIKPAALKNKLNGRKFISEIESDYELIIIDCTEFENLNDIDFFSEHINGVVIVVNEGNGRRQTIINKVRQLKNRVTIVGGILNNRSFPIPKIIYNRL